MECNGLGEVTKFLVNYLNVPKKGFKVYAEPPKNSPYVAKVEKQVNQVSSVIIEEICGNSSISKQSEGKFTHHCCKKEC
jgi:hypothetical protein